MKKNIILIFSALILVGGFFLYLRQHLSVLNGSDVRPTTEASVKFISSTITADGSVTAQDQATLHFQTSGKLVYLPLKEGDKVYQGETIASLDTYTLQKELTYYLNIYRSTRDTFDQQIANSQNNYLQAAQTYPYNTFNAAGISGTTEQNAINDIVKRIIDENQANLDNSVINVELANYALQLARLTSPLNGIVTHEDVTVPNQNVTTTTSFTVADPSTMVFRADVPAEYIYYVSVGGKVLLSVDGLPKKVEGVITQIYPSKVTLASGEQVYQVDVVSDDLKKLAKLDMSGTAIINTNSQNVALVPAWTVLGGKYIWIDDNGKPSLKKVTVGKIHGQDIEIKNGLSQNDKIIIDPKVISALKYQML